jgi:hypothetical protein
MAVQASLGRKQDPISKIIRKKKKARDVAQAIEHLPSKCEVLSSNPIPPKKLF